MPVKRTAIEVSWAVILRRILYIFVRKIGIFLNQIKKIGIESGFE